MLFKSKKEPITPKTSQPFKFLSYYFDKANRIATFCYQGVDNIIFTEKVAFPTISNFKFNPNQNPALDALLDRALFLAFITIGTSYYKTCPTPTVELNTPIDSAQANFFNQIYQEGLSQFAFENHLTRDQLAHFYPTPNYQSPNAIQFYPKGIINLQSGGKDSLLTTKLLLNQNLDFTPWYISSSPEATHPQIIDHFFDQSKPKNASIVIRQIDHAHILDTSGLNGHIPITLINISLAIVQAILDNQQYVLTSISQEGEEPVGYIGDLPVNHQWSKTWVAEQLLAHYVYRYLTPDLVVGSPLRCLSELATVQKFVKHCWQEYGFSFSSCNQANYKQNQSNSTLKWCGNCPKCACTYLLFCPFLPPSSLQQLFANQDLFTQEALLTTFKGLLGVDGQIKPFECVSSVEQLRFAYHHRQSGFGNLPFQVPNSNFNYLAQYPIQQRIQDLKLL